MYAIDNMFSSLVSSGVSVGANISSTSISNTDSTSVSIRNGFDCSTYMVLPTSGGFDPTDTLGSSH